ncbi:hypothetical protein ULF88_13755 [Halopseudomonas pachastrellae]|nr:hypothetical protein [Halopseudomonas pachastrellae]
MKLMTVLRIVFLYLLAVLVATLLGSLVQTQFNLAALQAMGVPVDGTTRLHSSLHDLRFFSPFLAVMVAACLLLALPLAEALGVSSSPGAGCCIFSPALSASGPPVSWPTTCCQCRPLSLLLAKRPVCCH